MKATPFSTICLMAMMHFMRKQVDDTDRCPANDMDFDTIWNEMLWSFTVQSSLCYTFIFLVCTYQNKYRHIEY